MPGLESIKEIMDVSSMSTEEILLRVGLLSLGLVGTWATLKLMRFSFDFHRIKRGLSTVPSAPGHNWLLGHVIPLLKCTQQNKGAWDLMEDWIKAKGPLVKFQILGTQGVALRDPLALKRIFQTGQRIYEKELSLSYRPFLPILGTGLVTADGELWQKQRLLMGPVLRADMLDDIIPIAKRAADRLCAKLEAVKGTGQTIEMEEEFRLLTLQVIGEAVLSLSPEECDRVGGGGCVVMDKGKGGREGATCARHGGCGAGCGRMRDGRIAVVVGVHEGGDLCRHAPHVPPVTLPPSLPFFPLSPPPPCPSSTLP